jgi:hypothetical protein
MPVEEYQGEDVIDERRIHRRDAEKKRRKIATDKTDEHRSNAEGWGGTL